MNLGFLPRPLPPITGRANPPSSESDPDLELSLSSPPPTRPRRFPRRFPPLPIPREPRDPNDADALQAFGAASAFAFAATASSSSSDDDELEDESSPAPESSR